MNIRVLRDATAEDHRRTESTFPLMDPALTLPEYAALLARLYALVATWEGFAATALPPHLQPLVRQRARASLLAADLETLHLAPRTDPAPALPAFNGTAGILGGMYVMEGSRLGGQLIAKHLEQHFGAELHGACTFFKGFAQETAARWREFVAVLEHDVPDADAPKAVDGARLMFRTFGDWMTNDAHPPA